MNRQNVAHRRRSLYTFLTIGAAGALVAGVFMSGCGASPNDSLVVPTLGFTSPTQSEGASSSKLSAVTSGSSLTLSEMRDRIETILSVPDSSSNKADCFSTIEPINVMITDATCYGPQLVYSGHPNGADAGSSTCTATVPSPVTTHQTAGGCLPSRDLGIWSETETTGEACSAAQLNSLVTSTAGAVNTGLELMAGIMCVMEMDSVDLPEAGASVDLTSNLSSVSSAVTFSAVTLQRESTDHSTGAPIYKLTLSATSGGQSIEFNLRNAKDGASSFGQFYGSVNMGASSGIYGISVVYEDDADADLVRFEMRSATTPVSAGTTGLFGSDNRYSFTNFLSRAGSVDSANARNMIASVDRDSGYGTVNFAWQAGGTDANTRVFRALTANTVAGKAGYAYFGFGAGINSASVGEMDGMCCNWAGPGASCSGSGSRNSTNVQAQSFTLNAAGVFAPTVSKITYAPTNSCNAAAGSIRYGTPTEWNSAAIAQSAVTHNLVAEDSLGTVPTLTAPTF